MAGVTLRRKKIDMLKESLAASHAEVKKAQFQLEFTKNKLEKVRELVKNDQPILKRMLKEIIREL